MAFCLNCGQRLVDNAAHCAGCGASVDGDAASPVDSGLTDEVRSLALDGRKIEAIKAYREASGASLAQAKDAVEGWLRGEAPRPPAGSDGMNDDAREHARAGRKLAAIKAYRDANRSSLKDAKDAVESWMRDEGIPSRRGGCAASLLVLLLGVAGFVWWR